MVKMSTAIFPTTKICYNTVHYNKKRQAMNISCQWCWVCVIFFACVCAGALDSTTASGNPSSSALCVMCIGCFLGGSQVDIGGHPPFPNGSKQLSGNFDNLLFLAGFNFRGHFEGLNEGFSRYRFSMIAIVIIEPHKLISLTISFQ